MLLITMREWFGPSREALNRRQSEGGPVLDVDIRQRAFITSMPLGQAIRRVRAYESSFNERYRKTSAIEFDLLQVVEIDNLDDEEINMSRAIHVEKLGQAPEEVGAVF